MDRKFVLWCTFWGSVWLACMLAGLWATRVSAQPACAAAPADPVPYGQVRLSWTRPTTYATTPPLALPASTPLTYRIYYSPPGATTFAVLCQTTALSAGHLALPVGVNRWTATAAETANPGGESAQTAPGSKTILSPQVSPPGALTVSQDLVVWTIKQSRDKVALAAVGEVPSGTPCDPAQSVLGKYVVPRTAVQWYGLVRPEVVLGSCG